MNWLKKKILKWLGLDYELYVGVDLGVRSPSKIIIVKVHDNGIFEVVGDQTLKSKTYQSLLYEIRTVVQKYRRKCHVVIDKPFHTF